MTMERVMLHTVNNEVIMIVNVFHILVAYCCCSNTFLIKNLKNKLVTAQV